MRSLSWVPLLFAALVHGADQDVITILDQQVGLQTFCGHLMNYPDLVQTLNEGTYTGRSRPSPPHMATDSNQSSHQPMRRSPTSWR